MNNSLKQSIWQAPVLAVLAGILTIGANHWRADSIPIVGEWSVETRFSDALGESLVVTLEQASQLFTKGNALFVDARPQNLYAQGHIRGALSIPWQDVDRYFMDAADKLDDSKTIITYCDGESCTLSHELANFLKDMGVENVRLLVNGWTIWQEAGLPADMEMN
ncbi:MAG: rhodanese-like domain-containing protein [Deltaproteobacteria bacterium]|nr:MAG: rhodanese-like domain-containing protein [Deltaproteobacteria bacterium]RLC17232.1 MAG: rhodanese-like domain-containing protein [Deltaproteobacteria bacterium]